MSDETKDPMTVTIALYRSLTHNWIMESNYYGKDDARFHSEYVRISEPLTITFAPIADDSVIQNAIEMLNGMEQKARLELAQKLHHIDGQRAQFLALTHQPAAPQ